MKILSIVLFVVAGVTCIIGFYFLYQFENYMNQPWGFFQSFLLFVGALMVGATSVSAFLIGIVSHLIGKNKDAKSDLRECQHTSDTLQLPQTKRQKIGRWFFWIGIAVFIVVLTIEVYFLINQDHLTGSISTSSPFLIAELLTTLAKGLVISVPIMSVGLLLERQRVGEMK
jgi:hypothetical protein